MPWIQIGQTLLIPWVIMTLYAVLAPNKISNSYDGNYYYTPVWRMVVVVINLAAAALFFLGAILCAIWS